MQAPRGSPGGVGAQREHGRCRARNDWNTGGAMVRGSCSDRRSSNTTTGWTTRRGSRNPLTSTATRPSPWAMHRGASAGAGQRACWRARGRGAGTGDPAKRGNVKAHEKTRKPRGPRKTQTQGISALSPAQKKRQKNLDAAIWGSSADVLIHTGNSAC